LIAERIRHVNRIKGLLFAQGISDYKPLRRDRRARLEALRTGDGRELPSHLKAQIGRELDLIELLLKQITSVEAERDAQLAAARKPASEAAAPNPVTMLLALKGMGANFAAVLWSEAFYRQFANRRQVAAYAGALPPRLGKAEASGTSRGCRRPAIRGCGPPWSRSPGCG